MLFISIQSISQSDAYLSNYIKMNKYNINIYIFFPALKIESISLSSLLYMQMVEVIYCFTKRKLII